MLAIWLVCGLINHTVKMIIIPYLWGAFAVSIAVSDTDSNLYKKEALPGIELVIMLTQPSPHVA